MFQSVAQLDRYAKRMERKERYSEYLFYIEIAVFITVFWVVMEVAYKLSSII
jgi:hypothetical protein